MPKKNVVRIPIYEKTYRRLLFFKAFLMSKHGRRLTWDEVFDLLLNRVEVAGPDSVS
ncbi:MAG: hypothetical protein NDF55_09095 [archaeon GB-1867-005]|nr:hypothetical protein [Candidatus Culexmicrobium cathedralense]